MRKVAATWGGRWVWLLAIVVVVSASAPAARGEKRVFRVCDDVAPPSSLNPYEVFSEKAHTLLQQMLEGLVRFDASGGIEPVLAERWERLGEDTVRFHLREGVRFHNGEPFDARAVAFSLMRYVDPAVGYPGAGFVSTIEDVEVVDRHTVDVVTRGPDGLLLNRLAAWVHIVPPEYFAEVGDAGFGRAPVGTGAFRFDRWEGEERIVLSANTDYWEAGRPRVDELVFVFVPAEEQVEWLLRGDVDLVTELPGTMTTRVMAAGSTRIAKQQAFWTVGATMNTGSGPLSDVRVRRALNHAIDREAMIRYGSRGNGQVLATLTMPGQEGHNPELETYKHDLERAERLLAEAGVERPLVLKTLVRAQAERAARIMAAQLALVDVHLDIQAVYSDAEVIRGLASEEWDIAIAGIPDPMCHSFFIQSILLSSRSPFSLQEDAEFDRRLMGMAQALDAEEREGLGRELDRYVHEQALSLFTYQKIHTYGKRQGVEFTPYISGMPYFFDAGFAEASMSGEEGAASVGDLSDRREGAR